eukprot:TRINITY_DN14817_c0_g1_i1.p1 TRINITY_DN14817_c0_g1~~TRINITY_DN14817_c0_g1_i1.p1  ORF type:complete len:136 (-),score=24.06 TRINITY_DN14817_c0_g1_i1:80-487(-)
MISTFKEDDLSNPERAWISKADNRHVIRLGSFITFTVKSVQEAEQFIDITGSLQSLNTGCTLWLARRSGSVVSDLANDVPLGRVKENGGINRKPPLEARVATHQVIDDMKGPKGQDDTGVVERNHKFKRKRKGTY